MAYGLIDDGFFSHPKVMDMILNPDVDAWSAIGIWATALSWAHKHTIDKPPPQQGLITAKVLNGWDRMQPGALTAAEVLADACLWERLPGGEYRIHDFRHWGQLDKREAKQRGGRASAHARWGTPLPGLDDTSVSNSASNSVTNSGGSSVSNTVDGGVTGVLVTSNTRPSPIQDQDQEKDFARFWAAYPKKVGKPKAFAAFKRALQSASAQVIIDGAMAYGDHRREKITADPADDPKFTAHPTTWLNRGGWADELDEIRPAAGMRERAVFE